MRCGRLERDWRKQGWIAVTRTAASYQDPTACAQFAMILRMACPTATMRSKLFLTPVLALLLAAIPACRQSAETPAAAPVAAVAEAAAPERDEHSHAEPDIVAVTHLALDLAVDFGQKTLGGTATLDLDWNDPASTALVLDSRNLSVTKVEAGDGTTWVDVPFALGPTDPVLGNKLSIALGQQARKVRVTYRTSPEASGLQWLTPAMTLGRKTPFMFSQSQQIHARSWVPLQDTTLVRFTYEAHVTSPKDVMVLMSADNDPRAARDGDYRFRMGQPIPSYLLAIAAGDVVFRAITDRAGVWAEPAMAASAAAEFAGTGRMMEITEQLYGPYRWDRYDILVLPPSFPYGGMENPRLTFATPTVITGDQSLVSLIAHELAHSWSGNLVTFATARDAWLNEGVTTYVENRIIEALYGKERADIENVIERNALRLEFTAENTALQPLAIRPGVLKDPDENLTSTIYTKGAWFLQFLEQRIGRAEFDAFLKAYFDHFAFQLISSAGFATYAKANLLDKYPGRVSQAEFDAWLYAPGVPDTAPATTSSRLDAVDTTRSTWLRAGTLPDSALTGKWTTQEWVHFLEGMPETLSKAQFKALDAAYKFTGTPNGEIAQRWYPLTVRSGYMAARPAIGDFLSHVGRRKLVMPIYDALAKTPDGLSFAREVFTKARPGLHPITIGSVESALADKPAPR
jgi:leukotriene-A4 hydrolase